ncbi:MAG: NADH:ubiquinone reductase (Na(+)-transporting) subunit C [Bacteroidetes bacterium]|nr:NADH:ubiquinone reductase (Na(+)-transporting) subunit C [Bacteroidota bacterium]MDA1121214.1 NADH:ubiquinone reductase (Na(+)-transporting) subunit C [Bacteroidota bacterium]
MRQSNTYILIFAAGLTIIVGGLLSTASVVLKPLQDKQVELDTKKKILSAVMEVSSIKDPDEILRVYSENISSYVVDFQGNVIEKDAKGMDVVAEKINVAKNSKLPKEDRMYPVFQAISGDKAYIFPMYGQGLWDWISGFIALEGDLNTVKGITFDHKTETPGLGARITDVEIQKRYVGKRIYDQSGALKSIDMVKGEKGLPLDDHHVDGMSGATMTGKGVNAMLRKYLESYGNFISKTKQGSKVASL